MTTMQKIKEIEDEVRGQRYREREREIESLVLPRKSARRAESTLSLSHPFVLPAPKPTAQMARTQKNKATAGHLGMLKV